MALGVGSSLDVNGIVTQLMQVEQQPLTALATKEAKYQAQLSAYGSLKGSLSTFQSALSALTNPAKFSTVSASFADTTLASATASSSALAGSYSVDVTSLAQSQKIQSGLFASTNTVLGTGTLSLSFGTYETGPTRFIPNPDKPAKSITISDGQSSLTGVRDAINSANAGITANIINTGSDGNRLVITSKDSGISNALRITVSDSTGTPITANTGLSQLAYNPAATPSLTNMTQVSGMEARNAELMIDGIHISKPSNTITDAIQGVTVSLLKSGTSSLVVSRDLASIQTSVQSFVTAYNDLNKTMNTLSNYDQANKKASPLTGDSTLLLLKSQLNGILNKPLSTAGGGLSRMSDIGITLQRDGTLSLNTKKLNTVLNDSGKDISTLFAAIGKPSNGQVTFVNSSADTKNGVYPVSVSQPATQGRVTGSSLPLPFTIHSGIDDELQLTIDGRSSSVTLAPGIYTDARSISAEIQSKINGSTTFYASGVSATVSVSSGGGLIITSNRYGTDSKMTSVTGSAAPVTLGTINYSEGSGRNIAGTISDVAAVGSGQYLTAGKGSNANGLSLSINAKNIGDVGLVSFARGYAYELNGLIGKMLDHNNLVDGRVSGINASIKDIGARRDELNLKLTSIEKRYRSQFTALDSMISGMNQTSNFLTQQLANLPGVAK